MARETITADGHRAEPTEWPPIRLPDCGGYEAQLADLGDRADTAVTRAAAWARVHDAARWLSWARGDLLALLNNPDLWARRRLRRAWNAAHAAAGEPLDLRRLLSQQDPAKFLHDEGRATYARWLAAGQRFRDELLGDELLGPVWTPAELAAAITARDLIRLGLSGWLAKAPPQPLVDAYRRPAATCRRDLGDELAEGWVPAGNGSRAGSRP